MTTSRGYANNGYHNELSFHDIDSVRPSTRRFSPVELRSDDQVYQQYETRNGNKYRNSEPESSNWCTKCCSKQCVIGLCIGLAIGIALVIAIVVPVAVTRTCDTNTTTVYSSIGTIYSTPNWTGTFLMDNGCDTTVCCCLYNQITLTQITSYQIQIAGSLTGQCSTVGSTVTLLVSVSTDFQTNFYWGSQPIRLQLGRNNAYLALINTGTGKAVCSATALRTA